MKVAIIGGGSIGLLYAYYLNQFYEVNLYVRDTSQIDQITSQGLMIKNGTGSSVCKLPVKPIAEWGQGNEDLSIICVKQYHLPALFQDARIQSNHRILFLQNGMGHLKWIEKLGLKFALVGTVEHGATRESKSCVIHTGQGLTRLAPVTGVREEYLESFIKPFEQTFPFQIEKDYKEMLIKKLVVNAIINPLTAILKVKNGALLQNPHFFQMFQTLFKETSTILRLENEGLFYENVVQVCEKTSENRSSMLRDLEEGRPTEIDAIIGYLLEEAIRNNEEAPLLNTLFHFIKGSEWEKGEE